MNIVQNDVAVPAGLRLPDVLSALPAAIYTTDASGMITFYNDAAAELWGYRPQIGEAEWCGSWKLRWPDGSPMRHDECPMSVALREGRELKGAEAIAERPDGVLVPFLAFPTLLRDRSGTVVGALNMLIDMSGQKRQEETAQRLVAIVESSDDAIVSKDLDGTIRSWNDGAQRLFGYLAEEVIGKSITILIPVERHDEEPSIVSRISRGERIDHYETVRVRKDRSLVNISLSVSPIRDSSGRVVGASKIARDITDRKETEKRILMLMREVNHRVKNQYAVILSMIRETSKRAKSPVEFEKQVRERIMALARSHDLLVLADWRGATIFELLLAQVKPFGNEERITMSGPSIVLQPNAVQYLGIAFHELATNSAKYGVLSAHLGSIDVSWSVDRDGDGRRNFHLTWSELNGPPISANAGRGFGKIVLERVTPTALGGEGAVTHAPEGVVWTLRAPMTYLETAHDSEERRAEEINNALLIDNALL